MVVHHRMGSGRARQQLRHPGHFLPQPPARGGIESERVCAAPAAVRARRHRRSALRKAPPRSARGARGLSGSPARRRTPPPYGSTTGRSSSIGERYVATIAARDFEFDLALRARADRSCCRASEGFSRKGQSIENASYYYSQPQLAVSGSVAIDGSARERHRHCMARSRVVERSAGGRRERLGLDRHQLRRRRRADGLPHARSFGRAALGGRHISRTRWNAAILRARRDPVRAAAALALAAHRCRIPGRHAGQPPATRSTRWNR